MRSAAQPEPAVTLRAGLWMLGAVGSFSLMAVAGRAVSFELDTFEIMLYRSLTGIVIVLSIAGSLGTLGQVTRRHLGLHLVRNAAHFTGQNLWFFAVATIPFAQVFALEFTTPIWAILLGYGQIYVLAMILTVIVFWRHRANIARLRAGTEPKIGQK